MGLHIGYKCKCQQNLELQRRINCRSNSCSAHFRLIPLRRPRCLPVALARSSPTGVRSRARSHSISVNTMAQCSIARAMRCPDL